MPRKMRIRRWTRKTLLQPWTQLHKNALLECITQLDAFLAIPVNASKCTFNAVAKRVMQPLVEWARLIAGLTSTLQTLLGKQYSQRLQQPIPSHHPDRVVLRLHSTSRRLRTTGTIDDDSRVEIRAFATASLALSHDKAELPGGKFEIQICWKKCQIF